MTAEQTGLAVIITLLMLLVIPVIVVAIVEIMERIARKRRRYRTLGREIAWFEFEGIRKSIEIEAPAALSIKRVTVEASTPQAVASITVARASCDPSPWAEGEKK